MNRINLILLFLVLSNFIGLAQHIAFKQEQPKGKAKNNLYSNTTSSLSANNSHKNSNKKVDKLFEKINSSLELNESDSKYIFNLCEERAEKIEKIKLNNDTSQQKIIDLQTINQDFDSKLKHILTANQFQKYEMMRRSGN